MTDHKRPLALPGEAHAILTNRLANSLPGLDAERYVSEALAHHTRELAAMLRNDMGNRLLAGESAAEFDGPGALDQHAKQLDSAWRTAAESTVENSTAPQTAREAAIQAVKNHPSTTFMAPYESLADAVLTAAAPLIRDEALHQAARRIRDLTSSKYTDLGKQTLLEAADLIDPTTTE
ncbi:hypothetical protein ACIOHA_15920 [Streptomyces anulatus]